MTPLEGAVCARVLIIWAPTTRRDAAAHHRKAKEDGRFPLDDNRDHRLGGGLEPELAPTEQAAFGVGYGQCHQRP